MNRRGLLDGIHAAILAGLAAPATAGVLGQREPRVVRLADYLTDAERADLAAGKVVDATRGLQAAVAACQVGGDVYLPAGRFSLPG